MQVLVLMIGIVMYLEGMDLEGVRRLLGCSETRRGQVVGVGRCARFGEGALSPPAEIMVGNGTAG